MAVHHKYMKRCFELARQASNNVKTNPNVGALLVYNNHIISEGYHERFGGNHAERNAIDNVSVSDRQFIKDSTLYVSLEPCQIHSKTPPCSDLIIKSGIKKLVVSVSDPNPKMQGKSLRHLKNSGIEVIENILPIQGTRLIQPFKTQLTGRPYIVLKFAQSSDAYIGNEDRRIQLSNAIANTKVHLWRSQVDGILIGYNTALIDNPSLTTRLVPGNNPLRVILDKDLSLPRTHTLWTDQEQCLFITNKDNHYVSDNSLKRLIQMNSDENFLENLLKSLFEIGIYRLMVEGGAKTLKSFINKSLWNETRIIHTPIIMGSGVRAPFITKVPEREEISHNNKITYHFNDQL